jgi:hypothetical protein
VRMTGDTAFCTRMPGVCILPRRVTAPAPASVVAR